jgi:hypothetical protein
MPSINKKAFIPEKERAFVLQGGGSLGAYEAGANKAIYEFLSKRDKEAGGRGRAIFNILAGKVDPNTLKIGELAKDLAEYKVNSIQKKIVLKLRAKIGNLNYYYKSDNLN